MEIQLGLTNMRGAVNNGPKKQDFFSEEFCALIHPIDPEAQKAGRRIEFNKKLRTALGLTDKAITIIPARQSQEDADSNIVLLPVSDKMPEKYVEKIGLKLASNGVVSNKPLYEKLLKNAGIEETFVTEELYVFFKPVESGYGTAYVFDGIQEVGEESEQNTETDPDLITSESDSEFQA